MNDIVFDMALECLPKRSKNQERIDTNHQHLMKNEAWAGFERILGLHYYCDAFGWSMIVKSCLTLCLVGFQSEVDIKKELIPIST